MLAVSVKGMSPGAKLSALLRNKAVFSKLHQHESFKFKIKILFNLRFFEIYVLKKSVPRSSEKCVLLKLVHGKIHVYSCCEY